jgi:hypothetical protein
MNARSALALSRRFALLAIVGDSVRETPGRPRTTMLGDKYCTFMIPFPRQTVCASEAVWGAGERAVRVRARGRQTDREREREREICCEREEICCLRVLQGRVSETLRLRWAAGGGISRIAPALISNLTRSGHCRTRGLTLVYVYVSRLWHRIGVGEMHAQPGARHVGDRRHPLLQGSAWCSCKERYRLLTHPP